MSAGAGGLGAGADGSAVGSAGGGVGSAASSMPPTPGMLPSSVQSARNSVASQTLGALSLLQPPGSSAGRGTQRVSMQFGGGSSVDGNSGGSGMF